MDYLETDDTEYVDSRIGSMTLGELASALRYVMNYDSELARAAIESADSPDY